MVFCVLTLLLILTYKSLKTHFPEINMETCFIYNLQKYFLLAASLFLYIKKNITILKNSNLIKENLKYLCQCVKWSCLALDIAGCEYNPKCSKFKVTIKMNFIHVI